MVLKGDSMKDTANEIGTIDECLYSMGNRIKIAKILSETGKARLLETQMEDIFRSCQDMFDAYCIKG